MLKRYAKRLAIATILALSTQICFATQIQATFLAITADTVP